MNSNYFGERKIAVVITLLLLIGGAILYFAILRNGAMAEEDSMKQKGNMANDYSFSDGIKMKAAYAPDGVLKIFALSENNNLKAYSAKIGNNLPEQTSIVIGSAEAQMMIEEGLFEKEGDKLSNLFGIDTQIEGVLEETGTFADDFHFLSGQQYEALVGEEGVLFIKYTPDKTGKLFYVYDKKNPPAVKIEFEEGNMSLFSKHQLGKDTYYPVILGSKEADMMIEEGLFEKTGDALDDFFGRKAIITGIAKETGTVLDMMHIVEPDFTAGASVIDTTLKAN